MKTNIKISLLLFALVAGTSCGKFLEPQSQQYFVPQDVQSIDNMLLGEGYPRPDNLKASLTAMLNLLDDDIDFTSHPISRKDSYYNMKPYLSYLNVYSWQPDMFRNFINLNSSTTQYKNLWEVHYRLILGANAAIDYIDKVEGSVEDKALVKAQGYALRGFYYFCLVNIYGEPYNHNPDAPGVPLKLNSSVEGTELPRNSVKQVYEQVISDLLEAERQYLSLPEGKRFRRDNRTSLPMVELLLSRVYLYMENWKEAARYADKVIRDWDFSLLDLNTLEKILPPNATNGNRKYIPIITPDSPESIWLYGKTDEYYNYITERGTSSIFTWSTGSPDVRCFIASKDLTDRFDEHDLRKEYYFFRETYWQKDSIMLPYGKAIPFLVSSNLPLSSSFGRAFRLSEAYLNLAEAAAMDPEQSDQTAIDALEALRINRIDKDYYDKLPALSGENLVERVRLERRLELCYENHRWFDLRRYGMPRITHKYTRFDTQGYPITPMVVEVLEEKDPAYTLPIPDETLDRNRALVQNKLTTGKTPVE